jgi:transcriptional regulator with XRE-family HTH domain
MSRDDRTQLDIAKAINVSTSAVNDWALGKKYPRMDKVEMLSNYFGIYMRDLIEEVPLAENEEKEILALYKTSTSKAKELAKMALEAGQDETKKGNTNKEG